MVIRAFDAMNTGAIPALQRHTISIEQQAQIRQAVAKRCQSNSTHYQSIYTALHQKFGIPRYDELLACDFDKALAFIASYEFTPNLNIAFIQNILADTAYQNKKAQHEIDGIIHIIKGLLHHIEDVQNRLSHAECCVYSLQKQLMIQ